MSTETTKMLAIRRNSDADMKFSGEMLSFSDTVFGFLDENYPMSGNSSDEPVEVGGRGWDNEKDEEDENSINFEEKKAFWDGQEKLLQGILCRTSSTEKRVKNATKEGLRQLEGVSQCSCGRAEGSGKRCMECLRKQMFNCLCHAGFNCSMFRSKWKRSPEIPSGEHTYLEVIEKSSSNKGEVRVVIELNFRAEFEMARASQEYNKLIKRLPDVYVGKLERLKNLIKILCGAAKKCMKEKKMHLGPWRKHKYMQAKWLSTCTELVTTTTATSQSDLIMVQCPRTLVKPRASMLTLGLLDKLSRPQCQVFAVA